MEHVFQRLLPTLMAGKTPVNTFVDHYLRVVTLYATQSSQISPINTLQTFTISHIIISHSHLLLPSTTMCFHRWPFIKRGYFGNSGIVLTVNTDGAALQRSLVYLSVRLVCLDARLPIKVFFALERKQTLPQSPFPSISLSFPLDLLVLQF